MRDPTSQVGQYLGGLDGVRGAGALAVLTAHCIVHFAPTSTPTGIAQILAQALTVFFAMSGMLIYTPFARDIARGERKLNVRRYVSRRLLRIFPVYLVIFVICDFGLRAVYLANAVEAGAPASDAGTGMMTDPGPLLLNLSLLQTFVPEHLQTGINPSWSLTTELTFYALLPVLAVWLVGRSSRRLALALIPPAVLGAAGLAGRAWAEHLYAQTSGLTVFQAEFGAHGVAVLSRSLLAIGDTFAVGMVVAVLFVWTERGELPRWTRGIATTTGWVLIVVGAVGGIVLRDSHPWFMGTFTSLAAGGVIVLMVDPGARRESSALVRMASWRPIEYLGEISLSLYLWHFPMIILASRAGWFDTDSLASLLGSVALVAAVATMLGAITFTLIERPAMTGQWPFTRSAPGDGPRQKVPRQ
ncbi:acyltransferase family protein [Aeromicrobium sp.]|uniref:acyltransferase family protein n=1 Tax=Aeromicrobium sp. TaxID=1871063 RepID=UPI003C5001B3